MANADFIVTISGAALSLLFYENVRNCGDQMGFLLGETLEFVVKTYTDADNQIETVKTQNNIETVITCPLPDLLYDSIGRINKENVKDFLRDKSKQVIGWFRFRRNTGLVPTMRDRLLHNEFATHFSNGDCTKEKFFVTCLLSSSTSDEGGTHKFKHVFLRRVKRILEPVPLRINNLENNSILLEGSDYKPPPTKRSSDLPDVFTRLIESLNLDLTRTSDLESAITIEKAAEQYLNQLIPELCKSDLEVAELEKQVKEFKFNKKSKLNGNSNNIDHETETERTVDEQKRPQQTFPLRKEFSEDDCGDNWAFKNHSTTTSQANTTHKPKNTVTYAEKTINYGKLRWPNAVESPSQEPSPHVNSVSELKVNVTDNVSNKIRRTNMESEGVEESIWQSNINMSGVGRGRGKLSYDVCGSKKARRTSDPVATRSNSERTSHVRVSQQESSEANCVQNVQIPYSQVTKKKANSKTDLTDNH
nr:PREDICTED: BRISC complex subunit Abro1-like isoform X1 [Megachile rotundata]XP_012146979.1 PREDICTED: BRISC complex subunit Abro1-like isoform X1 [Megachile rotundata]XP_012146980.1 PREDICTED: BRISC complex subunit Abro1-like isoform X1 [Megachile rotundata]XP_012146981.1 PREDICTED: BRISC complex subunit Abro1-like isoform X1 [Megachile rotundata]XP_012146982.1 PREDICTED: BRISC complex subunit Abro1-like isoform X1 [Megachile rotundata]XP_012146983.1 PREDICTED: BRISC complex subunit Abro1-l